MPLASLPLKHAITLAIRLSSLFLSHDLASFPDLFRTIGQLPGLNEAAGLDHQAEEVIVVDIHEDHVALDVRAFLHVDTPGLCALLRATAIFHHNAPGIIPRPAILINRGTLDGDLRDEAQAFGIRLTEDLLLRELELLYADLHTAERVGEKLRRQIGHDSDRILPSPIGVVLEDHADTGARPAAVIHLLALRMDMSVVFDRSGLQLIVELHELLVGFVNRDLILNSILTHC